ncbi:hypothetical protein FDUTEX481_07550 [Tolypothrix sp. PCC 7601]|nr:hypothetical protein FDUTEX481_07550 [Tolypothrix sp. PCC 7601]
MECTDTAFLNYRSYKLIIFEAECSRKKNIFDTILKKERDRWVGARHL